ncbi:spore coat U domain-containing protein [Rhabdaerophilum sp. SD176]|uniref:Csu type fimbrial protein n=1 Tax=Rhabdaerophilum sp. SD176 TaxID=2983548 RepID=UPI0024E025DA|nr:spore coat U domain-containing protein [Rhabdaerophilum sp. SD176]
MRLKSALLAAGLSLALVPAAHAATATGTLNLSITITASCTVVSASAINFGSVGAIGANIDQTSTLTVNCSNTTPYTVALSAGGGTGATVASRKMKSGTNQINYSLYRDAARAQVWGTTTGTDTYAGTGSGANQAITIYARVPSQAVPAPGTYTDAVTVTVTY